MTDLIHVKETNGRESVDARELGYNARYFHGHPWRIPGFGLQGMMHPLRDWREWTDRPEAERRSEWDAMPA